MDFKKFFVIILGVGLLLPILIFAQNSTSGQQKQNSCDIISNLSSNFQGKIEEGNSKIETKRADVLKKIEERWSEQDAKLTDKRSAWDINRVEHFAKLEEKFPDDPGKQAVLSFEQAVSSAITVRRAAIDSAIATFRQGMQQAKLSRQTAIDTARATFKNSIIAAFEKAKTDCANGVAAATVLQNLKNDLTTAKNKYQEDFQAIEKLEVSIDQLIAARKTAIEQAIQDFKTAMDKARADFKAAVGQETGSNNKEQACINSGGTVATSSCCASSEDFPNSCLIGACGCSLENSKEVKVCNCGENKCFKGNSCAAIQ